MTSHLILRPNFLFASTLVLASLSACTGQLEPPADGSGGALPGSGGAASGGVTSSGGAASGGGAMTGGTSTGGAASGGAASGGAPATGGTPGAGGGDWRDEDWASVPNGPTFQFVRKVTAFWNPSCTGADCHGGTPAHVNLIPDEGLYERLTTAVSEDICLDENDMPMKLIVPGEPENSAFIRILKGPCENMGRMPGGECNDGSDCLDAQSIAHLEQWVAEGALNN